MKYTQKYSGTKGIIPATYSQMIQKKKSMCVCMLRETEKWKI